MRKKKKNENKSSRTQREEEIKINSQQAQLQPSTAKLRRECEKQTGNKFTFLTYDDRCERETIL